MNQIKPVQISVDSIYENKKEERRQNYINKKKYFFSDRCSHSIGKGHRHGIMKHHKDARKHYWSKTRNSMKTFANFGHVKFNHNCSKNLNKGNDCKTICIYQQNGKYSRTDKSYKMNSSNYLVYVLRCLEKELLRTGHDPAKLNRNYDANQHDANSEQLKQAK